MPKFRIPVSIFSEGPPQEAWEFFDPNTAVLVLPSAPSWAPPWARSYSSTETIIGALGGTYRVEVKHGGQYSTSAQIRPLALKRVPVGSLVAIRVPYRRTRPCINFGSTLHMVARRSHNMSWSSSWEVGCQFQCPQTLEFSQGVPTCVKCKADVRLDEDGFYWETFVIQNYEVRAKTKKAQAKAARAAAELRNRPTVYEKLLDDFFFEVPPQPAVVPFSLDPDTIDETEDIRLAREAKQASAKQASVAHEAARREITTYHQARRHRARMSRYER